VAACDFFGHNNMEKHQEPIMTSKRQSDGNVAHVGCSEPNLGQKEAEVEKASQAQLRHIEGIRVTSEPGRFIAWCKQEEASISSS
jgi:hypothetical protein